MYLLILLLAVVSLRNAASAPPTALKQLLKLTADSKLGLATDAQTLADIKAEIKILALPPKVNPLDIFGLNKGEQRDLLIGCWTLLWTTEKETLFFAKNGLLGRKCTGIEQTIRNNAIYNTILFEGASKFEVEGSIERDQLRTNFKFKRAQVIVPPLINLTLPPIGAGWFDTVYVDAEYRVSADVRGDYLICRRKS